MGILAVTPKVGEQIIPKLKFRSNQKIVSFITTIKLEQLKKFIEKKVKVVRAIPLPPISIGKGPVPIYPPDKQVKSFFDKIVPTIEIKSEKSSNNFWSMSGMMAPFYETLKVQADWLVKKYGGEYLVRGGEYKVMEGKSPYSRNVLIKFPTYEKALTLNSYLPPFFFI